MSQLIQPRIFIPTGRTASGKSTLVGKLIEQKGFSMLPAQTTRSPRKSDINNEFNYLSDYEFDKIDATDMLFTTKHGLPARYTLLRSIVRLAIDDAPIMYTRPLAPKSANKVIKEFGSKAIKVMYLPDPSNEEAQRRILQRGDTPGILVDRAANEANWLEIAKASSGIHIAEGNTVEELYFEALNLLSQA